MESKAIRIPVRIINTYGETQDGTAVVTVSSARSAFWKGGKRAGRYLGIILIGVLPFAFLEPFLFMIWGSALFGILLIVVGPILHLRFASETQSFERIEAVCLYCKSTDGSKPYLSTRFEPEFTAICGACGQTLQVYQPMTNLSFKDLFSVQSTDYAKYRPTYPDSLFEYLSSISKDHALAWDCGTGNGQAATRLASYFDHVIGTDPSTAQLQNATKHPKVEYRQSTAESSGLAEQSVDLITAAQAFHWFKHEEFFREVKRVLKPGGILAIWCYALAEISPENPVPAIQKAVDRLYHDILFEYWEKERKFVEEAYQRVVVPFPELQHPSFQMSVKWSLSEWVGYLSTWSAVQTYVKKNQKSPLELIYPDLAKAWGDVPQRNIRWEVQLRVFKQE